ncbi:MAG TPA: hypothetical protein VHC47_02280 [Mucilaginibacter sp.]|nr:hypothetical protein [Mucilaginibacter sp.]
MKGADYKNDYNGSYLSWELYLSKAKKVFFSKKSEDTIRWANSTIDQDTIYKAELKKNDTTILGYTCDKLTFNCKSGIQVYYFNRQFSVKPSLYTDHKEGNWYAFLKMSGSIALKEIIENKQMIFTITATSVEQKDIDDSIFQLPADKPISELPIRQ